MKRIKRMFAIFLVMIFTITLMPMTVSAATLRNGSKGTEVRYLQMNLNGLGYGNLTVDSKYGPATTASVKKFQQAYKLTVDGIAGSQTQNKISTVVKGIQNDLKSLKYYSDTVDGVYGNNTKAAVRNFQSKNGLSTTGIANVATLNKIKAIKATPVAPKNTTPQNTTPKNTSSTPSNIPPASIHITQKPKTCTISAITMLFRANRYVNNKSFSDITLDSVMKVGWTSKGLKYNFTYDGKKAKTGRLTGTVAEKQQRVNKLLEQHPEGIVLYGHNGKNMHAVYMAPNGKILDPYYTEAKYINMSESANSISRSLSTINQYWILE